MFRVTGLGVLLLILIACSSDSVGEEIATQTLTTPRAETVASIDTLQPDQGRDHIAVGSVFDGYNSRPATSGPHWGVAPQSAEVPTGVPARWGPYDVELPDEVLGHNLEHGGVGLHYDCPNGCPETVQQLIDLAPRGFSQFIISPYSRMSSMIAITAWRHVLYLDEFDEARLQEFIDQHLDRAPESVPGNLF